MSKLQLLNVYVTQRLTAAATEISIAIETTVAELHDEISRSKEEVNRLRRLLITDHNPKAKIQQTDPQQLTILIPEEDVHPEQQFFEQEWIPSLGQEDPESMQVKEEQEELSTSQQEEQPQWILVTKASAFTPLFVNDNCDQENPSQPTHCVQPKNADDQERDSPPTKTTEEIKREPDVEEYRLPTIYHQPLSEVTPECSAAQSGKGEGADQGQIEGLPSVVKWTSKGESAHTSSGGRMETVNMINQLHTPICYVCGKYFLKTIYLKRHMKSHTGDKPYRCKACNKCFVEKVRLTIHMRVHTGEKPYRCENCGKCFSVEGNLSKHKVIHTGEKPYQCKKCGKCFTQNGTLSRHMIIHRGQKPFCCSYCGKCFTFDTSCKRHMRTVHKSDKIILC